MKQAVGWTILVVLVLVCLGMSIFNFQLSTKLAQELGSAQAQSRKAEQAVLELTESIAQLKHDQMQSNQNFEAERLASETAWTTSADGQLQVKLTTERDVSKAGQPMTLHFAARNNHSQPLTIDSPMLAVFDIDLSLNGQQVRYHGPVPNPAPPRPVTIQPGGVVRFQSQLTSEHFPELASPGVFEVKYMYQSGYQNSWKGAIGPLTARWVNQ
jgi:hypothetical protein